jgi:hypothetical protein
MAQHDSSYKLLFSRPCMVEDLLRGFVRARWIDELDFSTLEKLSGNGTTDDLRDRENDVIWRVRWARKDAWLYVYMLIEFQSYSDPFMPIRLLTYVGLLYQDLLRRGHLSPTGKLPPVLPLVLYNGARRWTAPLNVADLIEAVPDELRQYCPQLSYFLLDAGTVPENELPSLKNLVATMVRLERSDPEKMREEIRELRHQLSGPDHFGLRQDFVLWIKRVLLRGRLPEAIISELNDLQEIESMLAERLIEWTEGFKQEGYRAGEAAVVCRQLARRFGPVSAEVRSRVMQGTSAQLEQWSDRLLDAASLDEVFSDEGVC